MDIKNKPTTVINISKELIVLDFKDSLFRLEEIVELLEGSDISLEDSIKIYEEGMVLSKVCRDKLMDAEQRVYILREGKGDKSRKSKKRKVKKKDKAGEKIERDFDLFEEGA